MDHRVKPGDDNLGNRGCLTFISVAAQASLRTSAYHHGDVTVRQPWRGLTKPFRRARETDVKQSRRSIHLPMNNGVRPMLAEKFFLVLEALVKGQTNRVPTYSDGAPRVLSSSAHVPIVLPDRALTVSR
jgi:hypothetical protein